MSEHDLSSRGGSAGSRPSRAFRLGQMVQAVLLALAIAAVVLSLMKNEDALAFRYGGF